MASAGMLRRARRGFPSLGFDAEAEDGSEVRGEAEEGVVVGVEVDDSGDTSNASKDGDGESLQADSAATAPTVAAAA